MPSTAAPTRDAAPARASASPPHTLRRAGPTFGLWLCFTLAWLNATPAAGQTCAGTIESNLRRATAENVRLTLGVFDRDRARWRAAYGPEVMRHGVFGVGGFTGGDRDLCVPEDDRVYDLSATVFGAEGHTAVGPWRARALVLDSQVASDSWSGEPGRPEYHHTVFGGFVAYDEWLELGLLRFVQSASTVPGEADGWLVSAASFGVRATALLGEQEVESVDIGVGPIHLGPLGLAAGGRYLRAEGLPTAYVEVHDWKLVGEWNGGIFVDARAEMELTTGRLRSAAAVIRLTGDTAPGHNLPLDQRPEGFDPDMVRIYTDLRAMLSVFAGSRLPDDTAVPGGGLAWGIGGYGRNFGAIVEASLWLNDPLALDYAADPTETIRAVLMARFQIGFGD